MGKKGKERRVYSKEFKAEAAAPAERKEKPTSRTALDLDVNENMLRIWIQQAREAGNAGRAPSSPGTDIRGMRNWLILMEGSRGATGGGVKLRFTRNPKKSGRTLVRVIFTQTEPR